MHSTGARTGAGTTGGRPRSTIRACLAAALVAVGLLTACTDGGVPAADGDDPATAAADQDSGAAVAGGELAAGADAGTRGSTGTNVLPADTGDWDRTVAIGGVGGIPEGLVAALERDPEVLATTVIRGEILRLLGTRDAAGRRVDELPEGWWFPVEVLALEPSTHAEVVGPTPIGDLGPGEAVLSAASARVRGLGPGSVLELGDGTELTVRAVVDDQLVAAAEIAVSSHTDLGVTTPRAVLARTADADVAAGWASLDRLGAYDPSGDLRAQPLSAVRGDEVPVLRHAAAVLPPARLKAHFGEFAITEGPDRWVRQGVSWLRAHHTIAEVPLLGEVECHAAVIDPLTAAMTELIERGMAGLVDGEDFGGCWAPRTAGSGALSSHAWGIAVDLNVQGNHYGADPTIAPEVVEVMARHGFAWGGHWPVPDGMHFELVPDRQLPIPTHRS